MLEDGSTRLQKYDCIIVGAGAIGLSIAYELSRHQMRICVLDQAEPGKQTSWAAGGILPPADQRQAHDSIGRLRGLSHRLYPEWASDLRRETGIDVEYRVCGGLYLSRGAGETASLIAAVKQWRSDGINVEEVDSSDLGRLEPVLGDLAESASVRRAYWLADEAQVRSPRLTKALIIACRARGVEVLGDRRVVAFQRQDGEAVAVTTSQESLQAERFCVTAGAWTRQLMLPVNLSLELYPWRGQMALLSGEPGLLKCVVNEGPNYLVPRLDGRILAGSTVEEVGFDCTTTEEAIAELGRFVAELAPRLAELPVEATWAGLRPSTGDGLPFIGKVPGLRNVYLAAGHFRSGVHLAPGTAVIVSQMMRGEPCTVDPTEFRLERE